MFHLAGFNFIFIFFSTFENRKYLNKKEMSTFFYLFIPLPLIFLNLYWLNEEKYFLNRSGQLLLWKNYQNRFNISDFKAENVETGSTHTTGVIFSQFSPIFFKNLLLSFTLVFNWVFFIFLFYLNRCSISSLKFQKKLKVWYLLVLLFTKKRCC